MRQWGWKKEPPSPHDKPASVLLAAAPPPPPSASLKSRAGGRAAVLDQQRNDCVAHATTRAVQVALTLPGAPIAPLPSRDWVYYLAGVPTGDQGHDDGRYIRDAFAALSRLGWPNESVWPYGRWPAHPGGAAFRAAYDHRGAIGVAYHRITDAEGDVRRIEISRAIASGYPIVFGTLVTDAFEAQDGVKPEPKPGPTEAILGGHAIAALGYDERGVRFTNSWSADWGADGWGYLSWSWMTSGFVSDVWACQLSPGAAL